MMNKKANYIIIGLILIVLSCIIYFYKQPQNRYTKTNQTKDTIYLKGEKLFYKNCASCHYPDMVKRATAPSLGGVSKKREKKWLYKFIRNSVALYERGDKIAIRVRNENGNLLMTSFPFLSNKNIDDLLYFIDKRYEKTLRGTPLPYHFDFDKKDNEKAIACVHILKEKAVILNTFRPDSLRWYFGCAKKHKPNEWIKTSLKELFKLDSTINTINFLDYRLLPKAQRNSINEEWKIEEKSPN